MNPKAKVHFRLSQDEDGYPPVAVESLWASPTTEPNEFVIDNIPFFTQQATLGDVVCVREKDGEFWFDDVASRSKNSLLRVVFFDKERIDNVSEKLVALGCSTEHMASHSLIAVNVPASASLAGVQAYLQKGADAGVLDYEEPILRQ